MIRLLTLNTWKDEGDYDRRLALTAEGLADLRPDIVCLQEVFAADEDGRNTARVLAAASGLEARLAPARAKFRGGRWSTSGLCVLSAFPVRAVERIALPFDPNDGERIAQRVDLLTPVGPLRVVNLHLTHLPGRAAAGMRRRQLEAVLGRAFEGWSDPVVFAGDFNAVPGAPELGSLLARPDVTCSAALMADDSTMMAGPRRMIDLVALRGAGRMGMESARTVLAEPDADGASPSDHKGVLAVLTSNPVA